jgi:hypothetical protein
MNRRGQEYLNLLDIIQAQEKLDILRKRLGERLMKVIATKCPDCKQANEFYGEDINCSKHKVPDRNGYYRVGCRRCEAILKSDSPEDSFCMCCM